MAFSFDDFIDTVKGGVDDFVSIADKVKNVRDQFEISESAKALQENIYTPEYSTQAEAVPQDPLVITRLVEPQNQPQAVEISNQLLPGVSNDNLLIGSLLVLAALVAVR